MQAEAGWCGPGWKIAEIVGSWAAANTIIITMALLIWAAYRTQHSTTICTKEAAHHPLDTRHRHSSFHRNNNSNNTVVVTPDTTSPSAAITLLLIIVQCSGVPVTSTCCAASASASASGDQTRNVELPSPAQHHVTASQGRVSVCV